MSNQPAPDARRDIVAPNDTQGAAADRELASQRDGLEPLPPDRTSPQFTLRATITGMLLAGLLSVCSVYVGLKAGASLNMSITAALLGYAFWGGVRGLSGGRVAPWRILENNISQTIGSSGALVGAAGLAAPIPALAMLSGQVLPWHQLALWLFSVMLVGILAAIPVRRQMILVDNLPFPAGVATATMLRKIHARGTAALRSALALLFAALVAAVVTLGQVLDYLVAMPLPFSIRGLSARSLTFTFRPSPALIGVGGLIGFRVTCSILLGSILAYAVAAPLLIQNHYLRCAAAEPTTRELSTWLVWPGATLMVVASLVSLSVSWQALRRAWPMWRNAKAESSPAPEPGQVPRSWFLSGLIGVLLLAVVLQVTFFGIAWWVAVLAVLLAFVLAVVVARVSGETGMGFSGPMGKVTQLVFGALVPQSPVPNLMAANVTGGAAGQCADLLDDLKCGHLLGASPRSLSLAQILGALAGALVGSAAYLLLVPDPSALPNEQWAAPGAAAWKAVAEAFTKGLGGLPPGTPVAIGLAALLALTLSVLERTVPRRIRPLIPSPISLGLGFVITAENAISLFIGGLLALLLERCFTTWSARFRVAVCAGLVAGESLTGAVAVVVRQLLHH